MLVKLRFNINNLIYNYVFIQYVYIFGVFNFPVIHIVSAFSVKFHCTCTCFCTSICILFQHFSLLNYLKIETKLISVLNLQFMQHNCF